MLSVAICTRDRRDDLRRVLECLAVQEAARPWEVLVIDNASTDGTADVAAQAGRGFPVQLRYIREDTPGLSHARNRALREAAGRAVIFLDDDVSLPCEWLEGHGAAFEHSDVIGTGGRVVPVLPPETPEWIRAQLSRVQGGPTSRYDMGDEVLEVRPGRGAGLPVGANMGVLRKLALAEGGFRTDLGWGGRLIPGEETELFGRMARHVGRILYVPGAWVHHHIRADRLTPEYLRRWNIGYGRSSVLMKRSGWHRRLGKGIGQLPNLVRYAPVLLKPQGPFDLRAHRKFYQSVGRLAQLTGL